jgi:preprotein translocase subunit SecG
MKLKKVTTYVFIAVFLVSMVVIVGYVLAQKTQQFPAACKSQHS